MNTVQIFETLHLILATTPDCHKNGMGCIFIFYCVTNHVTQIHHAQWNPSYIIM